MTSSLAKSPLYAGPSQNWTWLELQGPHSCTWETLPMAPHCPGPWHTKGPRPSSHGNLPRVPLVVTAGWKGDMSPRCPQPQSLRRAGSELPLCLESCPPVAHLFVHTLQVFLTEGVQRHGLRHTRLSLSPGRARVLPIAHVRYCSTKHLWLECLSSSATSSQAHEEMQLTRADPPTRQQSAWLGKRWTVHRALPVPSAGLTDASCSPWLGQGEG